MWKNSKLKGSLILAALSLLVTACQGLVGRAFPQQETFYQPSTPIVQPVTPLATTAPQNPTLAALSAPSPTADLHPTATPFCSPALTYQEDLSIPDGTVVAPGAPLDKRWRVLNSGTCNWDERYRIKLVAGPAMGSAAEQALYPARSGTPADIRLLFTAPQEAGAYRSAWQAHDPNGQPFGDPIFIDIIVVQP
jgi:hypothetical protein